MRNEQLGWTLGEWQAAYRTVGADGIILADLYAGTDAEQADRAKFRGMTAMADLASRIAAVDVLVARPGRLNELHSIPRAAVVAPSFL